MLDSPKLTYYHDDTHTDPRGHGDLESNGNAADVSIRAESSTNPAVM
jgi:hypothetical protein